MANRFWVGGTADWNATAGTKWATTSGGVGGQTVPGTTDDVFFDAASGAITVTITATVNCANLTFTGFTGTLSGSSTLNIYSNLLLVVGMGYTFTGTTAFKSTTTGKTVTTTGKSIGGLSTFNGVGGAWTLQDPLISSAGISIANGSVDTNGNAVTCTFVDCTGSGIRSITLGVTVLTLTGAGAAWAVSGSNFTISAASSTIKYTNASSSSKTFTGGSQTYGILWFSGAGTGTFIISGSNTFSEIRVDTPPHTVNFTAGTTQTVTTLNVSGVSGSLNTLKSTSNGTAWNILVASGIVSIDYVSLRNSTAIGGATFLAGENSINAGGNSGWVFESEGNCECW